MQVPSNKIQDIVSHYTQVLSEVFDEKEAKFHLYWLLEHFCMIPAQQMALHFNDHVNESELLKVHFGVKDLLNNKPIQHIVGQVEFGDVRLKVNEHVLIPRPETEEIVSLIIQSGFKPKSILDIGTGSGAISISLAKAFECELTALEKDKQALQVALDNAQFNNARVAFMRMDFLEKKDWDSVPTPIDLIVSNPPYVRHQEKQMMSERVLNYEPHLALFVEDNEPLVFYQAIADFAKSRLAPKGQIWLEINEFLAEETADLFRNDYSEVNIIHDFRDQARFIHVKA